MGCRATMACRAQSMIGAKKVSASEEARKYATMKAPADLGSAIPKACVFTATQRMAQRVVLRVLTKRHVNPAHARQHQELSNPANRLIALV